MNAVATTQEQDFLPAASMSMGFNSAQGFELLQRAAKLLASSTLVPKEFQGNLPNCVIALNMANRIGADPLLVMQNLYIVHGRPGWSAQFLIATFNQCGRFTAMRFEFFGEPGKDTWGCRGYATEKSTGERIVGSDITIAIAKKEGWYAKAGSKWQSMPQQMLMYRAGSWLVRAYAPELSMGLQTVDELQDIGELRTVSVTAAGRDQNIIGTIEQELSGNDEPAAAVPDNSTSNITAQEVHDAIAAATTRAQLDAAFDLVQQLHIDYHPDMTDLYNKRALDLVGGE